MKDTVIENIGTPSAEELEKINGYTRREFAADELYTFSVVLCDNEIDRDYERFTDSALDKLAELFLGKTGIFDHSHKAENQCARIYDTLCEEVEGKCNRLGQPYRRLRAKAYMPKTEKTGELIAEIDAGIKKEVSVGCSVASSKCSVCGERAGSCIHRKGKQYRFGGVKKICFFELSEPTDAYEWSFVAVPAQPAAGVVKSFGKVGTFSFGDITRSTVKGNLTFSAEEAEKIAKEIEALREISASAGEFLKEKKSEIVKMFLGSATSPAAEVFSSALDELDPTELFKLYEEGRKSTESIEPQLYCDRKGTEYGSNNKYKI